MASENAKSLMAYWRTHPEGYNNVVYIRGTRKGFGHVKNDTLRFFQSKQSFQALTAASKRSELILMLNRYSTLRRDAQLDKKMPKEVIDKVEKNFFKGVEKAVARAQYNDPFYSSARLLSELQAFAAGRSKEEAVVEPTQVLTQIKKLEEQYKTLSQTDKETIAMWASPTESEGRLAVVGLRGLQFLVDYKDKLRKLRDAGEKVRMEEVTQAFQHLDKAIALFAADKTRSSISRALTRAAGNKMHHSTEVFNNPDIEENKDEGIEANIDVADGFYKIQCKTTKDSFYIQEGYTIYTDGGLFDENGEWAKSAKPHYMQLKQSSRQIAAWEMLKKAFSATTETSENCLLNGLVWMNDNATVRNTMNRYIATSYLEKILAGTGLPIDENQGLSDYVSVIFVNGNPIPVKTILEQARQKLMKDGAESSHLLKISFDTSKLASQATFKEGWKPKMLTYKNLTKALQRSGRGRRYIEKVLRFNFSINGNFLYEVAKSLGY